MAAATWHGMAVNLRIPVDPTSAAARIGTLTIASSLGMVSAPREIVQFLRIAPGEGIVMLHYYDLSVSRGRYSSIATDCMPFSTV